MDWNNTILFTTKNDFCTGCGICEDICPTKSIKIELQNGKYIPILNTLTCINNKGCKKCLKVCPGHSINLKNRELLLFNTGLEQTEKYIGKYIACYSGYSSDHDLRYHSASGGSLSQFLIYLLTKGYIQGAVITGFDNENRTVPKVFIATTIQDILRGRSSKYCPVSMNRIGNDLCEREGKYIIVGLPCHIHGFRKRETIDPAFKSRVFGYFSIYCSSNRTFLGTEYLLEYYKIDPAGLSYFAYRDEGYLGSMKVVNKDGTSKTIPYLEYYQSMRSFFKPKRCLSCIDHYGSLADVSFGDIYVGEYKSDKIGTNSIIVRNSHINELLKKSFDDGIIVLHNISPSIINQSQRVMLFSKKRKVYALQIINRFWGKKNVQYDEDLKQKISIIDLVNFYSLSIQRFIGAHKYLWFLIDVLRKR